MFLVPTVVAPSAIQGFGVFAAGPIPKGTVIWEFTDGVDWELTEEALSGFPEPYQASLRRWCYQDFDGLYILCGDNAKFMNHHEDPSCDDDGEYTTTARDIQEGDELTCDYRKFDRDARDNGLAFG